jgi:hypothetical protein
MGRPYISADIAARHGMYAVSADDHARHDIVAFLETQAHAGELVGQADQPAIQLDASGRHSGGKETLKGRAVERQECRAHLLPIPLS